MANSALTPWRRGSLASGGGWNFGGSGGSSGGSIFDLHRQMNRLVDELFDRGSTGGGQPSFGGGTGWPQLELEQRDNQIRVTAELPGVNEDDIELTLEDGMLTLAGEKRSERQDESGYSERSYGRFERRIALPADVDEEQVQADFRNGLLTVTIPRSEAKSRGRRIPLGSQRQGAIANNDTGRSPQQQVAGESDRWSGKSEGQQA